MKIEQKLQELGGGVFSLTDVQKFLRVSREYARLLAHRLHKRGFLVRVARGKYCLAGSNPYSVASGVVFPSYVSFLSALAFHHATTQIPARITVASAASRKPFEYAAYTIEFVRVTPKRMFGFYRARAGNSFAMVAEVEKAIVDSVYLPSRSSLSEAFKAVFQADSNKLCEYAERMKSSVVLKRIGYMLERGGFDESSRWKPLLSRKYDLLDPSLSRAGKKDKKWKLVVNRVFE